MNRCRPFVRDLYHLVTNKETSWFLNKRPSSREHATILIQNIRIKLRRADESYPWRNSVLGTCRDGKHFAERSFLCTYFSAAKRGVFLFALCNSTSSEECLRPVSLFLSILLACHLTNIFLLFWYDLAAFRTQTQSAYMMPFLRDIIIITASQSSERTLVETVFLTCQDNRFVGRHPTN